MNGKEKASGVRLIVKEINFLPFLAAGVIILAYTISFGFPNKKSGQPVVESPQFTEVTPVSDVFSGSWISKSTSGPEYLYEFNLKQNESELSGDHCFSIDNAVKVDCGDGSERITVNGIVENNRATISLKSSFSGVDLNGYLTVDNNKMTFEAITYDDIVPPRIELTRVIDSNYLVGIWQDSGVMGSGWSDHYNFYPDGRFGYYISQMKCDKRTIRQTGGWILEGNKLVLTTTREQVMVGGKLVKSIGSCRTPLTLEDGQLTERELPKPIVETYVITQREPSEDSLHESIDMGKTTFWKFDMDPGGRGEFDVEN